MSRHHNRPRPWDAPPGAVPGELRGQAGPWLAEHGDAGADGGHVITAARSLLLGAPGWSPGWQERIFLPNPGAGAGWTRTVPGPYSERLITVSWVLVTDAVVVNRFPGLQLTDQNGVQLTRVPAAGTVLAGSTVKIHLALHGPGYSFGTSGDTYGFLPDLIIPPGWAWGSDHAGYDPGDQESAVALIVHRFPAAQAGDPQPRHHEEKT